MEPASASIVVLNFDGGDLVVRSVASARDQDVPGVEVVVVDNGSADGSVTALRQAFPDLRIVENGANLGFARGMDVGIAATTGALVVPLNCDAVLHPSFVRRAREVLDADPGIGAVAPLVVRVDPDEADAPWSPAPRSPRLLDGGPIDLLPHLSVHPAGALGVPRPCFKPNGAAPVLRRAALDEVVDRYGTGPYDPVYVTYGEDVDLAFKLWALGWTTRYEPGVVAGHVRSYASQPRVFDKRGALRVLLLSSRHLNAWRHLRGGALLLALPLVVAGDVVLALRGLLAGGTAGVVDVVRAWRRVWSLRQDLRDHRRRHPPPRRRPAGVFVRASPRRRQQVVPPDLLPG